MKSEMMIGTFMICGVFAGCAHKPKAPARTENKTPTQAQRVQAFVALDEQGCPDEGERRDWTPIGVTAYRKELAAEKTKHVKQMFALSDDESRLFNPSAPHHVHELDDQTMALWTCAHPELFSRERTAIADASMDNYQQASIVAKDTCLADLAGKVLGIRINRGGTSDPTNPNAALRAIDVIKTTMDGMGVRPDYRLPPVPAETNGPITLRIGCTMEPGPWEKFKQSADALKEKLQSAGLASPG